MPQIWGLNVSMSDGGLRINLLPKSCAHVIYADLMCPKRNTISQSNCIQPQLHDNNNRVKPPRLNTELPNPLERTRNPVLGKVAPRGSHWAACLDAGFEHHKVHGPRRKGRGSRWTPDKRSCHRLPLVIAPGVWLTDGQKKR